ncbi:MAG TPA: phosphatidylserine decarboxylase [Rhodanobacteraceae bacterium]|nr:phosphatidylserine decarboxylase [Rhodanobacteraceae bacterium]
MLALQLIILCALAVAIVLWAVYFPYPSPLVRRWLPPRKRWPELQIRRWLRTGAFHPSYVKFFDRDPERTPPPGSSVLAPADGLVTSAEVRGDTRYLVIALSFWDMHVQRSPLAGTVMSVQSHGECFTDGEGRDFAFLREKKCPVQTRVMVNTASGELAVRLITSVSARRIETWVKTGDRIQRGQRIGRILLGSTVVLELPAGARLLVKSGERVRAGETPVAEAAVA